MKKTFRTILAGALALFAVSCYDDTALREEIKELDERVSAIEKTLNAEVGGINDLATRLATAEGSIADLTDDLSSLTSTVTELGTKVTGILTRLDAVDGDIDGIIADVETAVKELKAADASLKEEDLKLAAEVAKIAVVKVEEVAGNVVLTLADGKTVQVSKPLSNVDNNGLVTVVETEEGKFWAVLENGQPKSLDIPVGHPDYTFKFSVSADGELQYAVNGGEPVGTGVTAADLSGQKYLITDVVENEDNVVITVGDATYTFPKYVADNVVLNLSRSEMYVGYGFSKTVTLTGAEEFYVAAKPDGWKVTVEGNVLTISAPSKAAAELGVIETEGQIVVHADADGCVYTSMAVKTGDAFSVEVNTSTGMVTFFNALSVEYPDYTGMGSPTYDFGDALVGIIPLSDMQYFESVDDLISAAESWNIPSGYLANVKSNNELGKPYEAGKYEEDSFSLSISDLGASFWPAVEIEEGVHYAVWAVPQTDKVLKDLYTVAYYKPIKVVVEATDTTFNDVTIKPTLSGGVEYYANVYEASMFEYMPMKDFLETGYMGVGPWKQFQQSGMGEAMGTKIESGVEIKLSYLQYDEPLKPATEYVGYVFPIQDGKAPADYVYETDLEPYIFRFTTAPLEKGAPAATLTLSDATDYSSISVSVKVPEGTSAYYKFYDLGAADDMTDAELAVELMSLCYSPATADKVVKESYLNGGDQKELVVATITADGKYAIAREVFAAKSYPYSDAITVAVDSVTPNAETGEYTVVFSVTGATKLVAWNYYASSASAFTGNVMKYGAAASYSTYKWVDVVDGKATITVKPNSDSYNYLIYSAYNVADNAVSNLLEPASTVLFE